MGEDFKVELPAVVPVLKEVYEDDRGGIDLARAERGVQCAACQAPIRPTDAHGPCARGAALADEDQVGLGLARGGVAAHGQRS